MDKNILSRCLREIVNNNILLIEKLNILFQLNEKKTLLFYIEADQINLDINIISFYFSKCLDNMIEDPKRLKITVTLSRDNIHASLALRSITSTKSEIDLQCYVIITIEEGRLQIFSSSSMLKDS